MQEINDILSKNYINNASDIKKILDDINLLNIKTKYKKVYVTSHLIHSEKYISVNEQIIFNLDNYITYIKSLIYINPLELRYIINLTLNNKHNKILYSDKYYYNNVDYYIKRFNKMFMYNYLLNMKKINMIPLKFNDLINEINNKKNRAYALFENINDSNLNYYKTIIVDFFKC